MKQAKTDALAEVTSKRSSTSKTKQAAKNFPPPPPPVVENINPKKIENKHITKEEHINKIIKYQNNARFGPIITKELGFKYTRPTLLKMTNDNLETILHRIRTHLNTRNMDQVFHHMAQASAKGYEDVVCGFGYNIEGFSDLLLQNPAFHDAFERWKIEKTIPDIPPSFQLMYIIASTTYLAHLQNVSRDAKREKIVEKIEVKVQNVEQEKDIEKRLKTNYKPGDVII